MRKWLPRSFKGTSLAGLTSLHYFSKHVIITVTACTTTVIYSLSDIALGAGNADLIFSLNNSMKKVLT